ncbi:MULTISPECIES: hypothetical protein [Pseudoalteromonas]|uniref:Uncharacterized protein n=1 Tax=Pseudoalteromonas luteoviolacea (strain 2ta16) TaxID=1353533 RepID=V4HN10_PSEL2|nr:MULTISPECIES: hypothetical protein [Pseudoalteromonas]ESP92220.1 hypothetical protein PL2TA16_05057 [Pseudoalteromonas luteoviolacea 2ta16]KZN29328.1 hypothetical protein N483_07790 [Pseudoalteromonas luteoviolacea NCIMB 1944]MCG7549342.1 hypothetical protein [Pseudoalteromonas sp. Of7M-16]
MIKTLALAGTLSLLSFESFAAMDLATYEYRARIDSDMASRCSTRPISYQEFIMRIDWAFHQGLITERAAYWGKAYGYYPLVDFFDRSVVAICKGV